jgi:hypothetical protein
MQSVVGIANPSKLASIFFIEDLIDMDLGRRTTWPEPRRNQAGHPQDPRSGGGQAANPI